MLHLINLLLPALIPSWNFFDVIVPSPRIQYAFLDSKHGAVDKWLEFRPRPTHVSFFEMLKRMVWNPYWNESLFLMSCAERLLEYPTKHSETEIYKRLIFELDSNTINSKIKDKKYIQFRLVLIRREGDKLKEEISYVSTSQRFEKMY